MRVAIAGAGNVGQFITADLLAAGHQVTMIEKDLHVLEVARHLGRCGAEVSVFSRGKGLGAEWMEYDSVQVRRFYRGRPRTLGHAGFASRFRTPVRESIRWPQRFAESLIDAVRIVTWAKKHNIDLLYERVSRHSIAGSLASRLLRLPLIAEVNDLYFHPMTLRQAWAIVVPEPKALSERFRPKCFPLKWGVDTERIRPMTRPADLAKSLDIRGRPTVGFISSFLPWHGTRSIVQAAPFVLQRFPEVRFLMIGTGPDEHDTHEDVKQRGLEPHFVFTGFVEHSKIAGYLASGDVLIAPYSDHLKAEEGRADMASSLKVFEYMAAGRPVVVTEVGNRGGAVEHGVSGLVIPNAEPRNLADAICRLLEDGELATRMGKSGRAAVEDRYSWQRHSESLYRLFESIIHAQKLK